MTELLGVVDERGIGLSERLRGVEGRNIDGDDVIAPADYSTLGYSSSTGAFRATGAVVAALTPTPSPTNHIEALPDCRRSRLARTSKTPALMRFERCPA